MKEIDYKYEDKITCPYCGYKDEDSWETAEGLTDGQDSDTECGNCGKRFDFSVHIEITYSSYREEAV